MVESKFSKNMGVLLTGSLHLNVYILQILIFMQNVKYTAIRRVFLKTWSNRSIFEKIEQKYLTRFPNQNFKQPLAFIKEILNIFVGLQLSNMIPKRLLFKIQIKEIIVSTDTELDFF